MTKAAIAVAATLFCAPLLAQDAVPTLSIPASHLRVGFEPVRFPGDGKRVGLAGASYLIDLGESSGLSLGPAVYGAVTGEHGGFFTLGGEIAWRRRLIGPLGVELGVYAGGGGGGGAPPGGGLMLRPHVDLVWDLGPVAVGVSYSKVRFNGGRIDSNQLGVVVNASSDFRFVPAERLGEATLGGRAGLGFDRVQFSGGVYRTPAGRTIAGGAPLPRTIALFGARAERSIGGHAYWGVEANRAARGDVGGYAEVLGSVGAETELVRDALTVGARIAAGAAGGGGVSTGGGLLAKGSLYSIVRLGNDLGFAVEAGYARAPGGNFRATQASASLVWALDGPSSGGTAARPSRSEFSAGVQRYDAPRSGGGEKSLTTVSLKLDRYLTQNAYVTGSVAAAASGDASGYTSAALGAGWRQPLGERFHVGAELLAGAAGGGGVDGHGALLVPRVFAGVQLTPSIALRAGIGRAKALGGPLDATQVDLGVVVTYGIAAGR